MVTSFFWRGTTSFAKNTGSVLHWSSLSVPPSITADLPSAEKSRIPWIGEVFALLQTSFPNQSCHHSILSSFQRLRGKNWREMCWAFLHTTSRLPVCCCMRWLLNWPEEYFAPVVAAQTATSFLCSVCSRKCYPELVSHQGPQFVSLELEQFLRERSITHTFSAI